MKSNIKRALLALGSAVILLDGVCVGDQFFYDFGRATRDSLLNNVSQFIVNGVVESLVEGTGLSGITDPDDGDGNTNGEGTDTNP